MEKDVSNLFVSGKAERRINVFAEGSIAIAIMAEFGADLGKVRQGRAER